MKEIKRTRPSHYSEDLRRAFFAAFDKWGTERGLSDADMEKVSGVCKSGIFKIRQQERAPRFSVRQVRFIANSMGTPPSQMMFGLDRPEQVEAPARMRYVRDYFRTVSGDEISKVFKSIRTIIDANRKNRAASRTSEEFLRKQLDERFWEAVDFKRCSLNAQLRETKDDGPDPTVQFSLVTVRGQLEREGCLGTSFQMAVHASIFLDISPDYFLVDNYPKSSGLFSVAKNGTKEVWEENDIAFASLFLHLPYDEQEKLIAYVAKKRALI